MTDDPLDEMLMPVTETVDALTVMVDDAVLFPSFVLQVIVACPAALPVTTPVDETVATLLLEELHVTDLLVALLGEMVLARLTVLPTLTDVLVGDTLMPVTATVAALTVTVDVAVLFPSFVLQVIVACPTAVPVTTPVEETVATLLFEELHVTDLFVALLGEMVSVKVLVLPTLTDVLVGDTLTLVTATGVVLTVTVDDAVLFPSFVLQVIVACPTALPVTTPEDETVAILLFEELHVTDLLVALLGEMVLARLTVLPTLTDVLAGDTLTLVTAMINGSTLTPVIEVYPPSTVVHLIATVPSARPVTTPVEDTVAVSEFSDSHITDLFVALAGVNSRASCIVLPTLTDELGVFILTPLTETAAFTGTTVLKIIVNDINIAMIRLQYCLREVISFIIISMPPS